MLHVMQRSNLSGLKASKEESDAESLILKEKK